MELSQAENALMVFGPLLVKTAQAVAEAARDVDTPFITFTKRSGIPALGPNVFRLGATSDDQVREIVDYAMNSLGFGKVRCPFS